LACPPLHSGRGFSGRIAATRAPVVIPDLDRSPVTVVNPLMREKRVRSLLGVPLIVEGELIGVLHVGSLTQREFTEADVELLRLVGDRVALSIERSRLAVQGRIAQTLQRSLLPRNLPRLPGFSMGAHSPPAGPEAAGGGGAWVRRDRVERPQAGAGDWRHRRTRDGGRHIHGPAAQRDAGLRPRR